MKFGDRINTIVASIKDGTFKGVNLSTMKYSTGRYSELEGRVTPSEFILSDPRLTDIHLESIAEAFACNPTAAKKIKKVDFSESQISNKKSALTKFLSHLENVYLLKLNRCYKLEILNVVMLEKLVWLNLVDLKRNKVNSRCKINFYLIILSSDNSNRGDFYFTPLRHVCREVFTGKSFEYGMRTNTEKDQQPMRKALEMLDLVKNISKQPIRKEQDNPHKEKHSLLHNLPKDKESNRLMKEQDELHQENYLLLHDLLKDKENNPIMQDIYQMLQITGSKEDKEVIKKAINFNVTSEQKFSLNWN